MYVFEIIVMLKKHLSRTAYSCKKLKTLAATHIFLLYFWLDNTMCRQQAKQVSELVSTEFPNRTVVNLPWTLRYLWRPLHFWLLKSQGPRGRSHILCILLIFTLLPRGQLWHRKRSGRGRIEKQKKKTKRMNCFAITWNNLKITVAEEIYNILRCSRYS